MSNTGDSSDLLGFVSSLGGGEGLRVEENLGEGFVRLRVSEAERRQAKHDIRCVEDAVVELLRNARDAGARRIFVGTAREGDLRTTVVLDDGTGIPDDMRERVFDARVTSKLDSMRHDRWGVHGRGMALFSVREQCESAKVMDSGVGRGTAIRIVSDATKLPERADQSKWPRLTRANGSADDLSGPHNIIRSCCEFALEEPGCKVYVGSPSELVATVRARVRPRNGGVRGVADSLALAPDAPSLAIVAASVGIDMSDRTAYRILSGEIQPVRNCALVLRGPRDPKVASPAVTTGSPRISPEDREEFLDAMARDFTHLADRYYLELSGRPRLKVQDGRLTVTFDVREA